MALFLFNHCIFIINQIINLCQCFYITQNRAIGQKVLIKIAIHIDNSMSVAI